MAKKVAADVERIESVRELAKLVGRNKSTVDRWVKREDWTFGTRGPWKRSLVPDILRWAAAHLRDRSDVQPAATPGEPQPTVGVDAPSLPSPAGRAGQADVVELKRQKLAAEVRKLVAQANHAETALARERGDLLDAADVEMRWARVGGTIRNGFENLASEIVGYALTCGMPNASSVAFRRQVDGAVDRVLQKLSEDENATAEDDDDGQA